MTLRLILNADDFGYDPAVTKGIALAMRDGLVSSTTMMVNTPWSEDAARQGAGLSVGLHLNLVRFQAVSEPDLEMTDSTVFDVPFVIRETQAQLKRFSALMGREATHIDVHKHAHRNPVVLTALCAVAKKHSLPVRSIDSAMRQTIRSAGVQTNDVFLGDAGKEAYWTEERWVEQLDAVPREGVVEMMCHPGYRPLHLKSGYGIQREIELATFLSRASRNALEARNLTLTTWTFPLPRSGRGSG